MDIAIDLLLLGLESLWEYLSAHVLLCLIPAFFISGAFSALIPDKTIYKYMGRSSSKSTIAIAYLFAATSGLVLEVCSCTILPLFAGIWKKGAGFGPAITFLFAGPGVTLLSTPLTAMVIGPTFAIVKLLLSLVIAVAIGVTMQLAFKDKKKPTENDSGLVDVIETDETDTKRKTYQSGLFFFSLTMVMIFGTAPIDLILKLALVGISSLFTIAFALAYYERSEVKSWMKETYRFFKMIFPILLVGVFISGLITPLVPQELIVGLAGTNSISGNLFAVLFGTIAYFPTLVEVPIAQMFLELGMHQGPLMAYLIADPAVSIQTLLVINKIIKPRRTIAYAVLIIVFSMVAGMIYG
ncbi:MAG: permease, partial [Candidatus Thorarchaeota archaeon]